MIRRSRACIFKALCAAAILLCGGGGSSSSSSKTTATAADSGSATGAVTSIGEEYPECRTGLPRFLSDGDCDPSTNTPECSFDGGDCCSCSCVDGPTYTCGHTGFHCLDPEVSCTDDDTSCIEWEKGDSFCNEYNNNEDCSWDGGDCCECTCVDTEDNACAGISFNCTDPNAECFVEEDERTDDGGSTAVGDASLTSTSAASTCIPSKSGDGFCNYGNNIDECQYDGGDCCACTCVQSTYSCPPERFKCVDPDAECLDEDDDGWPVQVEAAESSDTSGGTMTSGGADTASTNDSAYDDDVLGGGTLQNDSISVDWGEDSTDRNYAEQDLSFLFSHCFSTAAVKDGVCDSDSNDQECGYDGGDCCSCTCVDVPPATCGSPVPFDCQDPEVSASCAEITSQTGGTADDSSSTELFVGVAAGAAVVVCIILGTTGYCCKRARQQRRNIAASEATSAPGSAPTNTSEGVPAISIPIDAEGIFGTSNSINSRQATLV